MTTPETPETKKLAGLSLPHLKCRAFIKKFVIRWGNRKNIHVAPIKPRRKL
ncbi:MAG: hypothetical protein WA821_02485 [Anaerolineales bacterium]